MRLAIRFILPAIALATLLSGSAHAGAVPDRGVGIHISPVQATGSCSPSGVTSLYDFNSYESAYSTPSGPFYFIYLMGCNRPDSAGLGGIECGVQYPGGYDPAGGDTPICVYDWHLCANLEFPSTGWPAPGGGNLITWAANNCDPDYPGVWDGVFFKVAGYFYMGAYSESQLTIGARPVSGQVKVADCNGTEHLITNSYATGWAGFGVFGWGGCLVDPLPVETTTWGRIKLLRAAER